jgi:hypothetical protein
MEKIKAKEMRDMLLLRRELDYGSMNSRMHKALTGGDKEFVFEESTQDERYDDQMFALGHRLAGKAPKPREKSRAGGAGGGGGVDSEINAIFLENYNPNEKELAREVSRGDGGG